MEPGADDWPHTEMNMDTYFGNTIAEKIPKMMIV